MELIDEGSLNKLKLSSKRLKSGKVQVKFQVSTHDSQKRYGYLLAEPKASLRDVVSKIIESYANGISIGYQGHLYNIGRRKQATGMLIFK